MFGGRRRSYLSVPVAWRGEGEPNLGRGAQKRTQKEERERSSGWDGEFGGQIPARISLQWVSWV